MKLPKAFYTRPDVVQISRDLLGKFLYSNIDGILTGGPGLLTMALGIKTKHYGEDLTGNLIWLEDKGVEIPETEIIASPRVGIAYAEEHVHLPWRFRVKGNKWTSKAK